MVVPKQDLIRETLSKALNVGSEAFDMSKVGFQRALPRGSWEDRMHFWQDSATKNIEGIPDIAAMNTPQRVGYWGGRLAGDLAGEVTRGNWWRYNHPLAMTYQVGENLAGKAGFTYYNEAAKKIKVDPAMAALYGGGLAAVMNIASGNLDLQNLDQSGRPRGYSPILASPYDPTESQAPLAEPVLGWLVGSRHKLLPWEDFSQERPDVSMAKYEEYKDYQSPMNGTFFGLEDTNPVLTSLAGGAIGAYRGSKSPVLKLRPEAKAGQIGKGAIAGGIAGYLTPRILEGATNLGIVKGTTSNLDGEPEAQFMGYKVPLSALLTTAGAGMAAYGLGRRWNKRAVETPFIQSKEWIQRNYPEDWEKKVWPEE